MLLLIKKGVIIINLFNLFAKISLDDKEFNKGVDSAEKKGKGLSGTFGGISKSIGTLATATVKAVSIASASVTALAGLSIKQYAEYEQLVGGVETLFKDSAKEVIKYSEVAYKTAGVSANTYMDTITSFSASLLQGLGGDTKKASELGNKAVIAMADNANKMGTSMDSIIATYQSLSRGNFAMLDNLKLGYGGTKEELQRLLDKAGELNGTVYKMGNFADVILAIQAIQDELGITGTTAMEAEETISGSFNAMKSAWANMLTGFADENADFDVLTRNLFETIGVFGDNLLPRIKITLEGLSVFLSGFAWEIPGLILEILPDLLRSGAEVIASLAAGIKDAFPELIEIVLGLLNELIDTLDEKLPSSFDWIFVALDKIVGAFEFVIENAEEFGTVLITLTAQFYAFKAAAKLTELISGFGKAKTALAAYSATAGGATIQQGLMNGTLTVGQGLVAVLTGKMSLASFATGVWTKAQMALNAVLSANPIGVVVVALIALGGVLIYLWRNSEKFRDFVKGFGEWLGELFTKKIPAWFEKGKESAVNFFKMIGKAIDDSVEAFKDLLKVIKDFVTVKIPELITKLGEWFASIPGKISSALKKAKEAVKNWATDVLESIKEAIPKIIDTIKEFFEKIPYYIGFALGLVIGIIIRAVEGWKVILFELIPKLTKQVGKWFVEMGQKIWETLLQIKDKAIEFFVEMGVKIWETLLQVKDKVVEWGNEIKDFFTETIPKLIDDIGIWFSQLPGKIWEWLSKTWNNIKEWGVNIYKESKKAAADFVNAAIDVIKGLPGKIGTWLSETIKKIVNWGKDLKSEAGRQGRNFTEAAGDAIKGLPSKFKEIGKQAIQGVVEGFKASYNWVKKQINGLMDGIVDGVKTVLRIHSPSRVFRDEVGKNMALGIGVGFENEMEAVNAEIQSSLTTDYDLPSSVNPTDKTDIMISLLQQLVAKDNKIEIDGRETMRVLSKYQDELEVYNSRSPEFAF